MPLTFPSHAAAVLPLLQLRVTRRLPATALVVGSTAPDLIYLLGQHGAAAHRPLGLLTFCLPAGLLAVLYLEGLLLPVVSPALRALLPLRHQELGRRLLGPRALPRGLGGWSAAGLAVVLGAVTHQLWDGFTHAWMWPARALYPGVTVEVLGRSVLLSRVLQHLSSALGLVVVLLYLRYTAALGSTGTRDPQGLGRGRALRLLLGLLALPTAGALAAAARRLHVPDPLLSRRIWDAAWSAAVWFVLLLGAACAAVRIVQSVRTERPERRDGAHPRSPTDRASL